ncbi:hypothetical protein [Fibrobacter sp. UWH9]|uniref:hypothetical protein n=1 Tax=Fibrobacter sp. UWH9 TaxID=1896213 RepID=UPI001114739E|nr:hypothetical protein [Fibrobacter sp. UWH9]
MKQGSPHQQPSTTVIAQKSFSGPMPAPEDMFRYRECSEDLPGRIMSLAEESSRRETMKVENQRQEIENQRAAIENQKLAIKSNNYANMLGLIFAFVLSAACIAASIYFVLQNKNIQAFVAAILPAAVFFKTFFSKK